MKSRKQEKKHASYMARIMFWMVLIILTIASIFVTFIIAPLAVFVDPLLVYIATLFLGILFGFIYAFVVMDLEHLERKHHNFLSLFIPAVAVLSIFLIVVMAKNIAEIAELPVKANPYGVAFCFLFSFIVPYLFFGLKHVFSKSD